MKKTSNRRDKQRILLAVLACVLALLMLLPMVSMIFTFSGAANTDALEQEISDLKSQSASLATQKKNLQAELSAVAAEKDQAIARKTNLEQQISIVQQEIENLQAQIETYDILIAEKADQVAQAKEKEAAQFDLFCRRVRAMEEEGTVSYWAIIFQAESFRDLLDRVNMINEVMDYDNALMDQLEASRAALETAQADLEAAQAELEAAKAAQESAKAELEYQEAQVESLISQINAEESQLEALHSALEAAAEEMDAEIVRKEKELEEAMRANAIQFDPGTGYYWPLPSGYANITSFAGGRYHPISGKYHYHTGTDIAAPGGTDIYAAHGGVVITSAYNNSYGEYVVISRGDGITTLYAHMSRRAVSVGQTVSQGQTIGYVGSTGSSTGNHLHFELRVNGVRKDALEYYPNVNWVDCT